MGAEAELRRPSPDLEIIVTDVNDRGLGQASSPPARLAEWARRLVHAGACANACWFDGGKASDWP